MNNVRTLLRFGVVHLYIWLLGLYPGQFRVMFKDEFEEIVPQILRDAEQAGGFILLGTSLREIRSLAASIIREWWHEIRSRKEGTMNPGENTSENAASGGGGAPTLEVVGMPGLKWIPVWTLLTTATFPAALIVTAPFAALILLIAKLGVRIGLFSSFDNDLLILAGFFIGLSLLLALAQWRMLRNYLTRAWLWFLATGAGVLAGGIIVRLAFAALPKMWVNSSVVMVIYVLPIGSLVGIAQWLVLRRTLPNAYLIIGIDLFGTSSLLLTTFTITNVLGLILVLVVLCLPGLVTGVGMWYLLRQAQSAADDQMDVEVPDETRTRSHLFKKIGLGLVAIVAMFFLCIWIYAGSQLALAKNEGIYPSVEEAVIARNSQGWGGANVVSIKDVRASVNQHDGSQPHVWFGMATVNLDRVPEGGRRSSYGVGSNYIHVKEGWVHVPEGAFPSFIGWVMELYDMEGVHEWIAENQ